jgi:hypothetical protein
MSGRSLEGAMLIETLVAGFVTAFVLIVLVGHVLLAQAMWPRRKAH